MCYANSFTDWESGRKVFFQRWGVSGLIKAIDKFDLSYDVKFSTYAVPMISGEIKRFRDDGMIQSQPFTQGALTGSLRREKMTDGLGRRGGAGRTVIWPGRSIEGDSRN